MLMQRTTSDLRLQPALPQVSADVRVPGSFSTLGEGESAMTMGTFGMSTGENRLFAVNPVMPEAVSVSTVTTGDPCTNHHGVQTGGFEAQAAEYHATGKGLIHAFWAAKPKADLFQRWKSAM